MHKHVQIEYRFANNLMRFNAKFCFYIQTWRIAPEQSSCFEKINFNVYCVDSIDIYIEIDFVCLIG